ncbi:hypothetical protein J5N97_021281 [Dioscorea zingiberensis]|uniref:Uncharacterized protein n=1 Tax=Dioscorea zingiberensis TaxID=325984 RepID=A0A9D5HEJ3_9LILI|nr:hypothetical protein J5N97_021281 [Dioscorea zingiberensis]
METNSRAKDNHFAAAIMSLLHGLEKWNTYPSSNYETKLLACFEDDDCAGDAAPALSSAGKRRRNCSVVLGRRSVVIAVISRKDVHSPTDRVGRDCVDVGVLQCTLGGHCSMFGFSYVFISGYAVFASFLGCPRWRRQRDSCN